MPHCLRCLAITLLALAATTASAQAADPLSVTLGATPAAVDPGQPVTFTATASGGTGPYVYEFFDENEDPVAGCGPGPSCPLPGGFPGNGTYRWFVRVTDGAADEATAEAAVQVGPPLQLTLAATTSPAVVGEPVTFTATASSGTGSGYTYAWFVDGSLTQDPTQFGPTAAFTFATTGPHSVRVEVQDDGRNVATVTETVNVLIGPPLTGTLSIDNPSPRTGESVTLTATPAGGKGSVLIEWDVKIFDFSYEADEFRTNRGPTTTFTMPTRSSVLVKVRLTDGVGQVTILERTILRQRDFFPGLRLNIDEPEVGDQLVLQAGVNDAAGPVTHALSVDGDGPEVKQGFGANFLRRFMTPGTRRVVLTTSDAEGRRAEVVRALRVDPKLELDLVLETEDASGSDDRIMRADATGTSGGRGPLRYAWDLGADGSFEVEGTAAVLRRRFAPNALPRRLTLRVTDAVGRVRTVTRNVPARCSKDVTFGLVQVTTAGCLVNRGTERAPRWETAATVKVNGIELAPPPGKLFVARGPTEQDPGGRIGVADVRIRLAGKTMWRGDIDWALPRRQSMGSPEERTVAELRIPEQVQLLGLPVEGSFALRFGVRGDRYYATFPLQFGLPKIFTSKKGGGTDAGVSAEGAVKVDEDGTSYDGLRLRVTDVWVGSVLVQGLCLSYVPAGGEAVAPCPAPTLDGREYLTCEAPVEDDRWNASALVQLPGGSNTRIGAFGGVSGRSLSSLGGFVDNARIPLVAGVYLSRLGFGFCKGPPLKLRGDVGVQILPVGPKELVQVNGYFIYTDAYAGDPWSIEMGGSVELQDFPVGQGSVTIRPTGLIDFDAQAGIRLPRTKPKVSVIGGLGGWVDVRTRQFTVTGRVEGCLLSIDACAGARLLASSRAIAGCIEIVGLAGGFGYYWVKPPDRDQFSLFTGCDLSPYEAVRPRVRMAQDGVPARSFDLPGGRSAAIQVRGVDGPPKVVVRGPDGTVITSPADREGAYEQGRWALVEDEESKTTSILLGRHAGGRWTVEGDGVASVATARYVGPSRARGSVRRVGGRTFRAAVRWTAPQGTRVTLVERSRTVQRTIARNLRGPGATVRFNAADGPGGRRELLAVFEREDGLPGAVQRVATFRAPPQITPGTPRGAVAVRRSGAVLVRWSPARFADRHALQVVTSAGRRFPVVPRRGCTVVRLRGISSRERVTVRITGLRGIALREGRAATVRLRAGQRASRRAAPPRFGTACAVR